MLITRAIHVNYTCHLCCHRYFMNNAKKTIRCDVHLLLNSTLCVAFRPWTVLLRTFYSEKKTHNNFKNYFLKTNIYKMTFLISVSILKRNYMYISCKKKMLYF